MIRYPRAYALGTPKSVYEGIARLSNGAYIHIIFGEIGTLIANIPASDTLVNRPARKEFSDIKWKVFSTQPLNTYTQSLYADLKIEQAREDESKNLKALFDITLICLNVAFPESLLLRMVTYTKLGLDAVDALESNTVEVFTAKQVVSLLVALTIKKYIPATAPNLLFDTTTKAKKYLAIDRIDAMSDTSAEKAVDVFASAVEESDESYSVTQKRLLVVHRFLSQSDPTYLPKMREL